MDAFLEKISEKFDITKKGLTICKPNKIHTFSMYLNGEWYLLEVKKKLLRDNDLISNLDSSILLNKILTPILNIKDLKTNKRIAFVAGVNGMEELKNKVDSGEYKVAFGLYPVKIKQIKEIADTNKIMPPKTTWIEPKLRSGVIIYDLS